MTDMVNGWQRMIELFAERRDVSKTISNHVIKMLGDQICGKLEKIMKRKGKEYGKDRIHDITSGQKLSLWKIVDICMCPAEDKSWCCVVVV